jgi:hypothetical protein
VLKKEVSAKKAIHKNKTLPLRKLWKLRWLMLRSSVVGTLIGVIPGAGGTIATFIAYNNAKSTSKHPKKFGKGSLEGVAAPEAANNGSVGGALVPLLTLGIPGSASTAVLIGALMVHKLNPGPQLFEKEPGLVYGLFISLFLANLVMLALGLLGNKLWVRIIEAPKKLLYPLIIALSFIGSYFIQNSLFDVGICLAFGLLGWMLKRGGYPTAPVILGLILGKMIEENLLDAVIGLPGNLFPTTNIPVAILVFDRSREKGGAKEGCKDVFFVDASREFVSGKNQNTLSAEHLAKIMETYTDRTEVEKYAHVAAFDEIKENDFNLNIPRYVDTFEEEEEIDIDAVQKEIDALEKELVEVRVKMAEKLKEIQR